MGLVQLWLRSRTIDGVAGDRRAWVRTETTGGYQFHLLLFRILPRNA